MTFSAGTLVQLALLFQCLGFLARGELLLRSLLLTGTVFYILYYFNISSEPLWEAIRASSVLATINFVMICVLIVERTQFGMSSQTSAIFQLFPTLTPGQFRRIMRRAAVITCEKDTVLCEEGSTNSTLYAIVSGTVIIEKSGRKATLNDRIFVGEIGFLTGSKATATIIANAGTVVASWSYSDLRKELKRSRPLQNALVALFCGDMAAKLSRSVSIDAS